MRGAQVMAKVWNRKMRENVTTKEELTELRHYNEGQAEVYDMIKNEYQSAEEDSSEGEELSYAAAPQRSMAKNKKSYKTSD